jgi:hypothetical protein
MNKDFWRDLYPRSETRRRLSRSSWVWIYLPIAASVLIAAGLAVATLVSNPGDGFMQGGQLAVIILAGGMLAAGFLFWLAILACLWGLGDILQTLPALTTRIRLRFVTGARFWKRTIHAVKRTAEAVSIFLSPDLGKGLHRASPHPRDSGRRKLHDE